MRTRRAGERDMSALTALFLRCFNAPPTPDGWTDETAARKLREIHDTPGFVGVVAEEEDGQLLGLALGNVEQWITCPHYFLREMCVEPARQGSGVGTRIFQALLLELRPLGVEAVYLLTTRGTAAVSFYAKLGFTAYSDPVLMLQEIGPR